MKAIIVLTLTGLLVILSGCVQEDKVKNLAKENIINQQKSDWVTYRNDQLGFEIKYPKVVQQPKGVCQPGPGGNNIDYGLVPVKIFEDGNIVYISTEYHYVLSSQNQCEKVNNTLFFLKNIEDSDYYPFPTWRLVFKEVNSDEELDQFVKEFYGSKCSLGDKTPASQSGVYDVTTKYDGKQLGESDCFINYMAEFKYFPQKKKAIAWEIGQESVFWVNTEDNLSFDEEIIDSFRFLD